MLLKDLLKEDRKNKCLTQEQYAKQLNISRGTLAHLEKGREPNAENARKISDYFGKSVCEILGNEKIEKLSTLETTNMLIDSLIDKKEIKENYISEEAKKIIWSTLELEIKLKLKMFNK